MGVFYFRPTPGTVFVKADVKHNGPEENTTVGAAL